MDWWIVGCRRSAAAEWIVGLVDVEEPTAMARFVIFGRWGTRIRRSRSVPPIFAIYSFSWRVIVPDDHFIFGR